MAMHLFQVQQLRMSEIEKKMGINYEVRGKQGWLAVGYSVVYGRVCFSRQQQSTPSDCVLTPVSKPGSRRKTKQDFLLHPTLLALLDVKLLFPASCQRAHAGANMKNA